MSTVIYPSPIFGPVHSRRLGVSLGINLLPNDGKWCSFDCLYCECGLNAERRAKSPLPKGPEPDVLTFAGNGEPTMHPHFPDIVDDVISLRNLFFPDAKISVLSNSTQIHKTAVREALLRTDNPIMKLDTVEADYINLVDRPQGRYEVKNIVNLLATMSPQVIIQTMFLGGIVNGQDLDNTSDTFVTPWLEALQQISPRQVMIYTIDRETPVSGLKKANKETLDGIAEKVRTAGFDCSVSY